MLLSLAYSGDAPPRACPGCGDSVPLAVTASDGTFYLGGPAIGVWRLSPTTASSTSSVPTPSEDAEMDLLAEEYWASLEPSDDETTCLAPHRAAGAPC